MGRDSVLGVGTRYGLGGLGVKFRWRRDFPHPSRRTLGHTHHPVQWVPGLFSRSKRPGHVIDHPPHLAPRLQFRGLF